MVMSPHALIPSATPLGLENVKPLRRNNDANALFAHLGEGDAQPVEGNVKLGRHAALMGLSRGVKPSSTVRAAPRPAVRCGESHFAKASAAETVSVATV